MPHNEVEPQACDAAKQSWESTPILKREPPEAVENSRLLGLLNLRGLFWLFGSRKRGTYRLLDKVY